MQSIPWKRGQRWVSDSEPELGLGIILSGGAGRVEIVFPAAAENRCYALESAPLRRVAFLPGDRIRRHDGEEFLVHAVREHEGLKFYQTEQGEVPEAELSDSISFSKPEERLFGGKLDEPGNFDLRGEALKQREKARRSPLRGLTGARMDLIPHQLFIADEVASRLQPRVLLADEVGLGKTIEACLILHRLLLTGAASRVLILVPPALVHQWFVELLRRFQLSFDLYDEERCEAAEEEGENPFLQSQTVLAPIDLLAGDPQRAAQALAAGWDVVVVDEAHHLSGATEEGAAKYEMVRTLAAAVPGLLLLTATPQQLGPEGHFARLQLLDPARYADAAGQAAQEAAYEAVADALQALEATGETAALEPLVAGRPVMEQALAAFRAGGEAAGDGDRDRGRAALVARVLDGFGLGRVMFRNTRSRLGGFPAREPEFHLLKGRGADKDKDKVRWLGEWLQTLPADEKVLAIGRTRELAEETAAALRDATGIETGVFHEELTLVQRDRQAAWFAEEEGARVLVCSEIGSEGRNFQFARHLVLLDLPEHADLLEQRIGRLDRIGQTGTIRIHVPYRSGTAEEMQLRWLDEGLDAFRRSPQAAAEIQEAVAAELAAVMKKPGKKPLETLLARTQEIRRACEERLARGQDRLLERSSHRPARSAALVEAIRASDSEAEFEDFLLRLLDFAGLHLEELGTRRYFMLPGSLKVDALPGLPNEGIAATFDRRRALEREQELFLTPDHPLVRGVLDWMLGSEEGNAAFGIWESTGEKRLLLESWAVVECVAPAALQVERFLPPTPVRVAVDHQGGDCSGDLSLERARVRRGDPAPLLKNEALKRQALPRMLESTRQLAEDRSQPIIAEALAAMNRTLGAEIARLRDLAAVNDHIDPAEIAALEQRQQDLATALSAARVRLDAVRLIWKAPPAVDRRN